MIPTGEFTWWNRVWIWSAERNKLTNQERGINTEITGNNKDQVDSMKYSFKD